MFIPIRIEFPSSAPEALEGKYSPSFIDEMSRQLTAEILRSQLAESLGTSTIELRLVFSPETYMEHTSENVTYRRLLLTDKGCSPRDFWVKWTRLDGAVAYSVSDTPAPDSIKFELAEDVSQKVREREYRYLVRTDADKYQSAMSRKNVTEWREILKRAIRRGDIIKVEEDLTLSAERDEELRRELSAILGVTAEPVVTPEPAPEASEAESELMKLAREALMSELGESAVTVPEIEELELEDTVTISLELGDEPIAEAKPEVVVAEPEAEAEEPEIKVEEPEAEPVTEERIRAEIEAKIRLEYENRARLAAEEETARLRREQELLRAENERLMEEARLKAEATAAEEARLKAEIEARLREEARLEAERKAAELARAEEERRLAEERKLAEAKALAEEKAKIEAERARREAEARALAEKSAPKYISRTAEFTFRRIVDPNVTKRIYEIVKATIENLHKEDVYIRIKASVPDTATVRLEFLEVPEEEGELVVNIIKALGKSDLGIAKATLD